MTDINCEEFEALSAELALGILDGRERADALAHLEHCPGCRQELLLLSDVADGLVELTPQAEPPAGFETRVLARIAREAQARGAQPGAAQADVEPMGVSPAGTAKTGADQFGVAQIGAEPIGAPAAGAVVAGAPQIGAAEVGAAETGAAGVGAAETGAAGVGAAQIGAAGVGAAQIGAAGVGAAETGAAEVGAAETGAAETGAAKTGAAQHSAGQAPPQPGVLPFPSGRSRRLRSWPRPLVILSAAAAAVVVAIGGWAVGHGNASHHSAPQATGVLSADLWRGQTTVGQVIATTGAHPWIYMVVNAGENEKSVICQVREGNATTVTVGSFVLDNGSGYWTAAIPKTTTPITGAQLVDATGRTIATATFTKNG